MTPSLNRTLALIVAASLALPVGSALAHTSSPQVAVQFPKGRSGTTLKGSVSGRDSVDYTLSAAAGQTMTVTLSGRSTVYHNVLAPGSQGEALFIGSRDGATSTTVLPTSGVYTVRVYQMGNAASSGQRSTFTLKVAITGGARPGSAAAPAKTGKPGATPGGKLADAAGRAGAGRFDATGSIPCTQALGQPMTMQCDFGVARAGGGTAVVSVTLPDGRKRALFFEDGKATGADLSQADGSRRFSARKQVDLYLIEAGPERYEVPEVVVMGD